MKNKTSNSIDTANDTKNTTKQFCNAIATFCNGIEVGYQSERSGQYLIAPYGDHKHGNCIQRIDEYAVGRLKHNLSGLWVGVKNIFGNACPVYLNHPDNEDLAGNPHSADKTPYGKVRSLDFSNDGLIANIEWLQGFDALPKRLQFSPRWACEEVADSIFSPTRLISIGLTHCPNIKNTDFANQNTKDKQMLEKILIALGLAAEATPEDAENKIKELLEKAKKAEDAQSESDRKAAELENALDEKEKLVVANSDKFKQERKMRAALIVANAIIQGKVTEAQRESAVSILANSEDFEVEAKKLDAQTPVLKTKSATNGIEEKNKAKSFDKNQANLKIEELVKAKEAEGLEYREAFNSVKSSNADLFKIAFDEE